MSELSKYGLIGITAQSKSVNGISAPQRFNVGLSIVFMVRHFLFVFESAFRGSFVKRCV